MVNDQAQRPPPETPGRLQQSLTNSEPSDCKAGRRFAAALLSFDETAQIKPPTNQIQCLLESKWRIYRVLGSQLAALRFLRRIGLRRRRLPQYHGQGSKDAPPGSRFLAVELESPAFRRSPVWQCVRRLDSHRRRRKKCHESWSIGQQTRQHPVSLFRGNEFALYSLSQYSCPHGSARFTFFFNP